MTQQPNEHDWFRDRIAAAVASGLDAAEQKRFEAHAAACGPCADELQQIRKEDQAMQAAFAMDVPNGQFEDRIIAGLRHRWTRRLAIHPSVRRAAAGVAALIILGAAGYAANSVISGKGLPEFGVLARARESSSGRFAFFGGDVPAPGYVRVQNSESAANQKAVADRDGDGVADGPIAIGGSERVMPEVNGTSTFFREPTNQPTTPGQPRPKAQEGHEIVYGDGNVSWQTAEFAGVRKNNFHATDGDYLPRAHRSNIPAPTTPPDSQTYNARTEAVLNAGDKLADKSDASFKPEELKKAGAGNLLASNEDHAKGFDGKETSKLGLGDAEVLHASKWPEPVTGTPIPSNTPPAAETADLDAGRKIIRTGQMTFEVESFDSAFAQISNIAREEGGIVTSSESQKLPNGKMTGSVTVRVKPENLDRLVLKLRALGELKNQKISAQDITKQYTDLDSQLRAARAMETRLLEIIKTANGQIKDLVAAEKELGVWREKIERVEGEIRYYNNQLGLSTLTIALAEKDVEAAGSARETETRNLGIETDDVEASYAAAQELVGEFKGRIISATMKKLEAQQMAATVTCEVAAENAGPMTDRLKQLGNVVRLESDRSTTTTDGSEPNITAKVERKSTRFVISMYNLANVAPRQTMNLTIAASDVPQFYASIVARVQKSGGRVVNSNLNQVTADQTNGTINFQVKSADADAVLNDIRSAGDVEVLNLTSSENTDTANVTEAKRGFAVQIVAMATVAPRETISLQLAAPVVADAQRSLGELLASEKVKARVISGQLARQDSNNASGSLDFEIRRADLPALEQALAAAGDVFGRTSSRSAQGSNTDSKVRVSMSILPAGNLPPRETFTMEVEARDVEKVIGNLSAAAAEISGRSIDSNLNRDRSGRVTGYLTLDVPQDKSGNIISLVRDQAAVKALTTQRNNQAPEGKLARARFQLTISNGESIVAGDSGVWASVRDALSTSVTGLLWSLKLIVIGLFLVVPWILVLWAAAKVWRRRRRPAIV